MKALWWGRSSRFQSSEPFAIGISETCREAGAPTGAVALIAATGGEPRILAAGDHSYYGPAFSPDGAQIAVARSSDGAPFQICLMGPAGGDLRCLTDPATNALHPAWSPDGRTIAYVSTRPGETIGSLGLMSADGSGATILPVDAPAVSGYAPSWSPDGRYLAYVGLIGPGLTIAVTSADGRHQYVADTGGASFTAPAWSRAMAWP